MKDDGTTNGMCKGSGVIQDEQAKKAPAGEPTGEAGPPPVDAKNPWARPITEGELRELIARAKQGDRTVLPALMQLLDGTPDLWKYCGDIAREAEALWIDLIAGHDLLVRQSLKRKVADMKLELSGPAATPLERLLVDRVVATWMQLAQADAAFAQVKETEASIAQLDLMQRRQERAQRAHLTAMKTLATVRRLAVTASPAAPAEVEGIREMKAQGDRQVRGREEGVAAFTTSPEAERERAARDGRQQACVGKSNKKQSVIPKAVRDRMRGLVGSEN